VVVLMIEVAAMIELAVVEMAFARSKVALSGTTPAANAAAHMATLHMAATPATGYMATTPAAAHMTAVPYETWKAKFQKGPAKPHRHAG
jgi:hypothetical protein